MFLYHIPIPSGPLSKEKYKVLKDVLDLPLRIRKFRFKPGPVLLFSPDRPQGPGSTKDQAAG